MADENDDIYCLSYTRLFEKIETGENLSPAETQACENHQRICRKCDAWRKQHLSIAQLAIDMPQFDVSEGLTQKILGSIEKESTPGVETSIVPLAVAATFAFILLIPFDSIQSLYGWGAGILGLVILQMLINTANSKEQLV